jgi:hypothetical protein
MCSGEPEKVLNLCVHVGLCTSSKRSAFNFKEKKKEWQIPKSWIWGYWFAYWKCPFFVVVVCVCVFKS